MNTLISEASPPLSGMVELPSSKSHSMRALMFALLANGPCHLYHLLECDDTQIMKNLITHFGAEIITHEHCTTVIPPETLKLDTDLLWVEQSGLAFRFAIALAGLINQPVTIAGHASLGSQRRAWPLVELLQQQQQHARYLSPPQQAPLYIHGQWQAGHYALHGEDSQPLSALMMVAPLLSESSTINVHPLGEKGFVEMTQYWLRELGVSVTVSNQTFHIPKTGKYPAFEKTIPGDMSTLAFLVAASLMTQGHIQIRRARRDDTQPDATLFNHLYKAGARWDWEADLLKMQPSQWKGFDMDCSNCIDALPILATLAQQATGPSRLFGINNARFKECDRVHAILNIFPLATLEENMLLLSPQSKIVGSYDSYTDHRIAMSLAIYGLMAGAPVVINQPQCIAKTYPTFVDDMVSLGAKLSYA